MVLTSTLGSPGIEIREVDNSIRLDSSTSTTVYVPGFASQGPVEEVMSIGSIEDFELIYGKPTNAAERYFYYTVKALLDNGGTGIRVLASRLPYGAGEGDSVSDAYTLLAYPAVPVIKKNNGQDTDCMLIDGGINRDKMFILSLNDPNQVSPTETGLEDLINPLYVSNEESTFEIHIEEEYLAKYQNTKFKFGFDTPYTESTIQVGQVNPETKEPILGDDDEQLMEDVIVRTYNTIPSLTDKTASTPPRFVVYTHTETEGHDGSVIQDVEVIKSRGNIATEYKNGKLLLHLSYTLYDAADTNSASPIGVAIFKLVYVLNNTKEEEKYQNILNDISKVGDYHVVSTSKDDTLTMSFSPAFEIAASYDGQSIEQLGNWNTHTPYDASMQGVEENTNNFSKDVTYVIGAPVTFQISLKDYYNIITGDFINWSRRPYDFDIKTDHEGKEKEELYTVYENTKDTEGSNAKFGLIEAIGHSAFIVINTSRTTVNENFEGYFLGLNDNMFVTPSDDYVFNAINSVKVTTDTYLTKNQNTLNGDMQLGLIDSVDSTESDFDSVGNQRLTFQLDSNNQGSISRVMSRNITSKDISTTDFDDTLNLALFKLSKTTDTNDILKLSYSIREKYNWSYSKTRMKSDSNTTQPVSYYVNNVMDGSNNISVMVNPFLSDKDFLTYDGVFHGKLRILSDKLVNTMNYFESKYLCRTYTMASPTSVNKSLITPIKLATANLLSYKEMIKQAGISPYLIHTTFRTNQTQNAKPKYHSFCPLNSLYPFGVYTTSKTTQKIIGQVPTKLKRALQLVENDEEYPDIDLLVEGGLGTIFMNSNGNDFSGEYASRNLIVAENTNEELPDEQSTKEYIFDETVILTGVEDMRTSRSSLSDEAQAVIEDYISVTNVFLQFANSMQNGGRGDTFFISDVPRGILIKGRDTKVANLFGVEIENNAYDFGETVVHSFPTSIYYPIKHLFDATVSTYASVYAQWVKIYDDFSGEKVWIPVSGHIAANIASTDAVYGPWYAAAGLRRGVIQGVIDYAISPTISQRTDLYKICINSVPKIPNYGVTIWGIRTMSKKDSAFDQNTCRRTFLYMEKKIKQLLRYYIFEPNISYTRLQVFNDIDPFLEGIKNKGGIYNYQLVCDTTVNTPEIINNGDMAVAISAAPTRTAENIIVQFTANKYTETVTSTENV